MVDVSVRHAEPHDAEALHLIQDEGVREVNFDLTIVL
jgi:hypothetical protein